ncbi:hypothetical protein [Paraburkholderia bonniea]|uniref:hypothetical protein n=1 Tax=Paraburkholderia bonniea TaxID=2152891 RepID=UPI0012912C24|nr:hypothetical protein [Paraburkholderia bonniea]
MQANLQVQNGSPGTWNQRASDFLGQAHGMLPADGASGPGYMFYTTPEQKANPEMYAQYDGNGAGMNRPAAGDVASSVNREQAYRDVYGKLTWGAAAGAGAIATGGVIAALPGAPIFSSGGALGTGALASPVGTGTISAGINAGSQYLQNGKINPVDVTGAFVTGAAGSYGGLLWNVGVNAIGGATTTALNNFLRGRNDSVMGAAIISGVLSSFGYGLGKLSETGINSMLRPTINTPNWSATGVWGNGGWNLLNANNFAPIGGSIGGSFGQEGINGLYQRNQSQLRPNK